MMVFYLCVSICSASCIYAKQELPDISHIKQEATCDVSDIESEYLLEDTDEIGVTPPLRGMYIQPPKASYFVQCCTHAARAVLYYWYGTREALIKWYETHAT